MTKRSVDSPSAWKRRCSIRIPVVKGNTHSHAYPCRNLCEASRRFCSPETCVSRRKRSCRNGESSSSFARLAHEAHTVSGFPGGLVRKNQGAGVKNTTGHQQHNRRSRRNLRARQRIPVRAQRRRFPSEPFPSPRGLALLWLQAGLLARLLPPPTPSRALSPAQWPSAGFVWLTAAGGCTGMPAKRLGSSTGFPFHLLPEQEARHLKAALSYAEIKVYTMHLRCRCVVASPVGVLRSVG